MRVQALEASGPSGAADPDRELGPKRALLGVGPRDTRAQPCVGLGGGRPALDASGGLHPCEHGDEMRAREPELRGERRAFRVERHLLRDRGEAERTPDGNPPERAWPPAELALDDLAVIHPADAN
jgi:hypothetical protein